MSEESRIVRNDFEDWEPSRALEIQGLCSLLNVHQDNPKSDACAHLSLQTSSGLHQGISLRPEEAYAIARVLTLLAAQHPSVQEDECFE